MTSTVTGGAVMARRGLLRQPAAAAPASAGIPASIGGRRLAVLDGIRGWASLIVLLYHLLPRSYGQLLPELDTMPVGMVLDGPLAVYVFFILSGEALSAGYLQRDDLGIVRTLAARRYFRLTVPILLASTLVWLAMVTGLDAHRHAAAVLGSDWIGRNLAFAPSVSGLLHYALCAVYFDPPPPLHYVPFLWTMRIELLGSCVVFGMLALLHGWGSRQKLACCCAGLLLLKVFVPMLLGFVLGMLLGAARQHGLFDRLRRSRWRAPVVWAALALVLSISAGRACAQTDGTMRSLLRAHLGADIDTLLLYPPPTLMYANALGLFLLVPLTPPVGRFLGNRVSRFLGAISFPLYLVHFTVIITLASWLAVALVDPAHPARATLYGIGAAAIAASLLLAWGFSGVERWTLRLANAAVSRILGS